MVKDVVKNTNTSQMSERCKEVGKLIFKTRRSDDGATVFLFLGSCLSVLTSGFWLLVLAYLYHRVSEAFQLVKSGGINNRPIFQKVYRFYEPWL